MNEKKQKYLPFHAVNEFMRDDYRLTILQDVLSNLEKTMPDHRQSIGRMITKGVQIQGFRNSNLAPIGMKVKNSTKLFERSPEFAAVIMEAWSRLHEQLKTTIGILLQERDWVVYPSELDRSRLPGFQIDWPKKDNFSVLIEDLRGRAPELSETDDDISLMVVWVGNRLPYSLFEEETNSDQSTNSSS